jgi:glycine betaine/proline transport system substrate-binding protein
VVTAPDYATRCPNVNKLMTNLKFTAAQESQMMVPIMDRKAPTDVAKQWLKDHPEDMKRWLDGVTTFDGKDAATAVQVAVNK